ncbi:uncharacterized protein LOC126291669 [Schistocerca gregaria]|uniref:uncharacterized protein LOC126291669 n=1 Tax=Schistocerca gregaria TaxID=7010 RepID=UPI00211DADEF|nr:uncharacterized protein LOC126291669 [Schistocerca gregaria]
MSSTTSSATIQALSAIFRIEGLPQTIVSDNGPKFMSTEFQVPVRRRHLLLLQTMLFNIKTTEVHGVGSKGAFLAASDALYIRFWGPLVRCIGISISCASVVARDLQLAVCFQRRCRPVSAPGTHLLARLSPRCYRRCLPFCPMTTRRCHRRRRLFSRRRRPQWTRRCNRRAPPWVTRSRSLPVTSCLPTWNSCPLRTTCRPRPSGAPVRLRSTLRPLLSLYGRIHRMLACTLEQVFRRFPAPLAPNGRVRVAQPRLLLGSPLRRIRQHGVFPTAGGSLMPQPYSDLRGRNVVSPPDTTLAR